LQGARRANRTSFALALAWRADPWAGRLVESKANIKNEFASLPNEFATVGKLTSFRKIKWPWILGQKKN
jgi:hypothetical protein